jgi:threonine/homoserine/homoserine lactone efflux protein
MPDFSTLGLFALAALALLVVPGPSVLYIVTRSVDQGRAAGLASVAGVHTGSLVHIAAAAVGLSAILMSSAVAFSAVKYLGAAYLVFIGVRRLLAREDDDEPLRVRKDKLSRIYYQGIVVNTLNPKTALFFPAFLPQFVDTGSPVAPQVLFLGLVFICLGALSDGAYALSASALGSWLRTSSFFSGARRFVTGGVYLTLGAAAALSGSRPSSST